MSRRVHEALESHLLDEDHHLIQRVHVFEGWGGIHFVDVYAATRRRDAPVGLDDTIHRVVGDVLRPLRYAVQIIWVA